MAVASWSAADYRAYLDQEVLAFVDQTNRWYPTDTYAKSVQQQRRIYDEMCRAFFRGYPEGVGARDVRSGHVPLRHYSRAGGSAAAAVLYAHGGGNVVGGLHSHDDVCADICHATGFDVVAVDYRLSPEYTRADSFDDCMAGLGWVRRELGLPVVVAGDSAGVILAAGLVICERAAPDLLGLAAIYGGFGPLEASASMIRHAYAPLLTAEESRSYEPRLGLTEAARSLVIPLAEPSLAGLLPVFAAPAECDPIADQSVEFVRRIRAGGGVGVCHVDTGLVHGHLRARHRAAKARESFARLLRVIALLGQGAVDQAALERAVAGTGQNTSGSA